MYHWEKVPLIEYIIAFKTHLDFRVYEEMSHHVRVSEILKLTFSKPLLFAKLSANKQVRINNSHNTF